MEDRYKLGYRQALLDVLDLLDSKIDSNSSEMQIGDLMNSVSKLLKVMQSFTDNGCRRLRHLLLARCNNPL